MLFTVFIQMTPRWDGQARAVLLGALSSPYLHPKIAIDATKPPLWRTKEREEYTRVKPKGADDPGLQDLLRRLASMA